MDCRNRCLCGAQFCYNCGIQWKTCSCEQWNEHRLLARAYQIIDREPNPPAAAPPDPLPNIDEPRLEGQVTPEIDIDQVIPEFDIESHLAVRMAQRDQLDEEPQPRATAEPSALALESQIIPTPEISTPRDILVARTIQELRENHECNHSRWQYIHGPHRCEECSHYLGKYIFECRQCRLQACNRCRRNRL
jgi:hypothetical protein